MLKAALFPESWLPIINLFFFSIKFYVGSGCNSGSGTGMHYSSVPLGQNVSFPARFLFRLWFHNTVLKGQRTLYLQLCFYCRLNWRATGSTSTDPSRPPPLRRPSRIKRAELYRYSSLKINAVLLLRTNDRDIPCQTCLPYFVYRYVLTDFLKLFKNWGN